MARISDTAKVWRLARADRQLLMGAAAHLWAIRLGLWLLPFQTLRRLLDRASLMSPVSELRSPGRIAWAVAAAARYVPRATCLTQAMAVEVLLRRNGHHARIHLGVARSRAKAFQAHAWVESRGKIVIGGAGR